MWLLFILIFILPIDLYWWFKIRPGVPKCPQEEREKVWLTRTMVITNLVVAAAVIGLMIYTGACC